MRIDDITARLDAAPEAPLLVFGGPYSNLSATKAMRAIAEAQGIAPDRVICTGDVVAYCAEPEETAKLARDWGCHVVAGNCEEQLAAGAGDCGCGFEPGTACDLLAKGWYPFADRRVSVETRAWMRDLPVAMTFTWQGLRFRVIHGGVSVVNKFIFASEPEVIAEEIAAAGADVVIAGHAGLPFAARARVGGRERLWYNAGVIGMPANDGTTDGWYGLVTPTGRGLEFALKRLAYDHQAAAASMRRWAYADGYAKSLLTGLWPSLDIFPPAERAATGIRLRPRAVTLATRVREDVIPAG
jgi:predicted phosphodiesterase